MQDPTDRGADTGEGEDQEGVIREPENSTVDDWMGQSIARDEEVAERAVEEADSMEEAQQIFDEEAEGEEIHEAGYPPPTS